MINQQDKLNQIFAKSTLLLMSFREDSIYLSKYFCPKDEQKMNELFSLVFAGLRITFENKRGILDYLSKNNRIDIETIYPKMLNEMQDLFSDRKVLSHYPVDTSKEAEKLADNAVRFISLNNKLEFKEYNENKIKIMENQMFRMTSLLLEKNLML